MQITVHSIGGRQYPFSISDGKASTDFLKTANYWEVYDRPILRIHDGKGTWAFNPDAIEKIHFLTQEDPGWRPPENILSSKCITAETYRRMLAAIEAKPQGAEGQFEEGKLAEAVIEIALASGAAEFFECLVMLRQRREQLRNLYYAFQKMAYPIPCEKGGFVLLNPRRIVCIHLRPAPPEEQGTAWRVDEVTENVSM